MARFTINGVTITPRYLVGLEHENQEKLEEMLSEMRKVGIRHTLLKDHGQCIKSGCLKKTGLGTAVHSGKKVMCIAFKSGTDLVAFETLLKKWGTKQ